MAWMLWVKYFDPPWPHRKYMFEMENSAKYKKLPVVEDIIGGSLQNVSKWLDN